MRITPLLVFAAMSGAAATSAESFDEAWPRLKEGRTYQMERTGRFSIKYPAPDGKQFDNVVDVPAEYSPTRRWPLRVQLHGGVGRPGPRAAPPGRPIAQQAPNRIPGISPGQSPSP